MAATSTEIEHTLALFCDFENVALGVRDAKFPKFDMQLVLERLLLKGNISRSSTSCMSNFGNLACSWCSSGCC